MALIVGVVIGLVLGLTGAGGSVFAVPLLIVLLGLPAQQAIGLSLGAVAISALFGSLSRLKGGDIQWLPAMVYAVVGGLVAPLGNWSNRQIDESVLMIAFSVLVLVIASRMWIQANRHPQDAMIVRAGQQESIEQAGAICRFNHFETFQIGLPCVLGITVGASVTGLLSRLFGVGGGFLIVPTLLFLTGITIRQAVATSLVIIAIVSGSGFVSYLLTGEHLNTSLLLLIASGGVVGMVLGIVISRYIAGPGLQKLFFCVDAGDGDIDAGDAVSKLSGAGFQIVVMELVILYQVSLLTHLMCVSVFKFVLRLNAAPSVILIWLA